MWNHLDQDWRLKNIELNTLPVYYERCIKIEIKYGGKVYHNFRGLTVPEDGVEC